MLKCISGWRRHRANRTPLSTICFFKGVVRSCEKFLEWPGITFAHR